MAGRLFRFGKLKAGTVLFEAEGKRAREKCHLPSSASPAEQTKPQFGTSTQGNIRRWATFCPAPELKSLKAFFPEEESAGRCKLCISGTTDTAMSLILKEYMIFYSFSLVLDRNYFFNIQDINPGIVVFHK